MMALSSKAPRTEPLRVNEILSDLSKRSSTPVSSQQFSDAEADALLSEGPKLSTEDALRLADTFVSRQRSLLKEADSGEGEALAERLHSLEAKARALQLTLHSSSF